MGRLTVNFIGICTHVRFSDPFRTEYQQPPHRVVLVLAPKGQLHGHEVSGHKATTAIDGIRSTPGPIRMWVKNPARGQSLQYDPSYDLIPRLTNAGDPLQDEDLDRQVVVVGDRAGLHFDISEGRLSGVIHEGSGAIYAKLEIETEGVPALEVEGLPGSIPMMPDWPRFTEEMSIGVGNEDAVQSVEEAADFLFHYKIFTPFPSDPGIRPGMINRAPKRVKIHGLEINGPGCSNSAYP